MSDIIIPGVHGIGTRGFAPTDSGYNRAASALVELHNEGRPINESDYDVRRILDYHRVSSIDELAVKQRGW